MNNLMTENDAVELLYRGKGLQNIAFVDEVVQQFNSHAVELGLDEIVSSIQHSKEFNIPQHYKDIDVEEHIRKLVEQGDPDQIGRVEMELAEFKARNLFPIIQLLIYIIDTMRKNNLVWGIGRGSAVSSYLLYLLGVHKVDSVKYKLDIKEFLK